VLAPHAREVPLIRRRGLVHVVHADGQEHFLVRGPQPLEEVCERIMPSGVLAPELNTMRVHLAHLGRVVVGARTGTKQVSGDVGGARGDNLIDVAAEIRREDREGVVAVVVENQAPPRLGGVQAGSD
jgi:hypothetical protein